MPHKETESSADNMSPPATKEDDVDFDEWAGNAGDADSSSLEADEETDHLFEGKLDTSGVASDGRTSDDEDYTPTAKQTLEEQDEEFDISEYVDEVKMKQEEDRAEAAKEASLRETQVSSAASAKSSSTSGKKQVRQQKSNARVDTPAEKHKSKDRSPRSQDAGPSLKKKPTGIRGPRTMETSKIYRQVNLSSQNRRTCQRLREGASTPERTNRWQHTFKTRVTFRLRIPSVEKPEAALVSILKEFVQELRRVDSTAAILPWKSNDTKVKRVLSADDVPTTVTKLRKYLKKFYVGKPNMETTTYPGIYLGHNNTFDELRESLQDWLETGGHAMFYMMLQAEDSTEIGWLLYTTREMNAGAMADEIGDLVGVQVGLRWKVIDINVKGKIPDSQKVNALVVEVETEYRWESQQSLIKYFGRHRKDICKYPNGVRVRFVKNRRDALNASERGKLDRLRSHQQLFLSKIQSYETWDILQLDYSSGPAGTHTLRQMIMGLTVDEDTPLFHNVDLDWKGVGYVFQFSPELKAQAECTIHTLLPLLQHHYPNSGIQSNFTQRAIDRCKTMVYDEDTGTVIDPTVEQSMNFLDEETLPGFSLDMSMLTQSTQAESRPSITTGFPSATDSVSTLGQKQRVSKVNPSPLTIPSPSTSVRNDDQSIVSTTSAITIETIQTVETQLHTLQQQVASTDSKFTTIMELLRQGNGIPQQTEQQDGTSRNPVTLDAGDDSQSVSGKVP